MLLRALFANVVRVELGSRDAAAEDGGAKVDGDGTLGVVLGFDASLLEHLVALGHDLGELDAGADRKYRPVQVVMVGTLEGEERLGGGVEVGLGGGVSFGSTLLRKRTHYAVSNQNTLEVDGLLASRNERRIVVIHSAGKDGKIASTVRLARHVERAAAEFLECIKELEYMVSACSSTPLTIEMNAATSSAAFSVVSTSCPCLDCEKPTSTGSSRKNMLALLVHEWGLISVSVAFLGPSRMVQGPSSMKRPISDAQPGPPAGQSHVRQQRHQAPSPLIHITTGSLAGSLRLSKK